jgi:nucleoside-diphosphate-sugar epimerase
VIKNTVCLVTGGAGTIGSTIVDQLVTAGAAEIRVLDNFVRGRGISPVLADLTLSEHRGDVLESPGHRQRSEACRDVRQCPHPLLQLRSLPA